LAAIAAKSDTGSETDTLEKLQAIIGTLDKVAPVAVNDTNSANENTVTQTGNVKTNDTSLDNTETFALVGSNVGTYGTLTLGTNGAYTYTYGTGIHAITANVTDTFTYRVTDAAGNTSTATLAVTVTPVNDAATFSGDISKATTETDVAQTITGQLTVADVDSATTVVAHTSVAGSAGLGNFTINSTGAWSYVMNNAQNQL
jgi:VCBS repeat-containing protein